MHRMPRLWLLTFLTALGCSPEISSESGSAHAAEPPPTTPKLREPRDEADFDRSRPDAVPTDQLGAERSMRPHLNLLNLAHMADVDQQGLFIDLGTPAGNKYTVGGWNTGWGQDAREGDFNYAFAASDAARLYLPLPAGSKGPLTLRVRLKAIGTATLQPYLNNEALSVINLRKGEGFGEYDIDVPAGLTKAGENYLLLRFGGTTKVRGEDIAAAVDYVRVLPKDAAAGGAGSLPRYASLVRDVTVGGQKRKAITVRAPATISYYVDVPADGALSFRVGALAQQPTAKLRVTPEGGATKEIFSQPSRAAWQGGLLPLSGFVGQIVRVDLVAEGQGELAWSSPTVMVPVVEVADASPVKSTIVLLIDTLRASKLRTYNPKEVVKTPVLDRFATEGTVFEAAQAPENWTKPSVASVLTSLYPMTHRTKRTESKLPREAIMVSEVFKKGGRATGTFLANGYVSNKFGFDQGWDYYTNYIRESKSTEAQNVFRDAGNWIEKHKDQPFFVYIQTIDPHVPYDPPKQFLDMYDAEPYDGIVSPRQTANLLEKAKRVPPKLTFSARDKKRLESLHNAEISYHDHYLGLFIERLKKMGIYDDVMFVVTSDHGEEFYEHGSYGHGHSVYQEMIHVPMMFRRPGIVPAGQRIPTTVSTMDIVPTVLTAAGLSVPDVMEGRNRLDHIRGDLPPGPAVAFTDFLYDRHVIRAGRYKLIVRGTKATLFDLKKDPGEKVELDYHKYPVAMRYCRMMLGQFLGAPDRSNWLAASPLVKPKKNLKTEDTNIDKETHEQLKALGYAN